MRRGHVIILGWVAACEASAPPAFDLRREQALKEGVMAAPAPQVELPRLAAGLLPSLASSVLAASPVPVLVPERADLLATAQATRGEGWYSLAMATDGVMVVVRGSRRAKSRPALEAQLVPQDEPAVTSTHGIFTLSFLRSDVAYGIDVECKSGEADPRCADATFVRQLYDDLRRVEWAP